MSSGAQAIGAAARVVAIGAGIALLAGCHRLPDCIPKAIKPASGEKRPSGEPAVALGRTIPNPAHELLIGIDGSGSMLGHTRAANPHQWETMLQAIKTTANASNGVAVRTFRIGGGNAQELRSSTATAANDPCFFQGCGSYASVPSSLQTLWQVTGEKTMPMRLLVSDLEVNDDDISSLTKAIGADIQRGASVGVLALRLPFTGDVFNAKAKTIFNGSLNRPVYLLATGEASQVKALLSSIREKMSLSGVSAQELSLIDAQSAPKTLLAKHIDFAPQDRKSQEQGSLRLEGHNYTFSKNQDYRFARVGPTTRIVLLSSVDPWPDGTRPTDFMLARLQRIPLRPGDTEDPQGIRITSLSFSGTQIRIAITIPKDDQPGAIRATIPAGSLPEPWWISWTRNKTDTEDSNEKAAAKEKTDGFLDLMIALSQKVRAAPNAPPAAAFCLAFDFSQTKSSP